MENTNVNENYFLERSDITDNYKNRAELDIIYKNPEGKVFNTPFGNFQATVLGVHY